MERMIEENQEIKNPMLGNDDGVIERFWKESDAKTLDELIEDIKSDGYLEDEDKEWAYVYITRPVDSKCIIKR